MLYTNPRAEPEARPEADPKGAERAVACRSGQWQSGGVTAAASAAYGVAGVLYAGVVY